MNTYTTRANAIRGAARKGYNADAYDVIATDDGRFAITSKAIDIVHVAPIANPCKVIWAYLADNTPTMKRRDMTRALKAMGINSHTVNTQTYKYFNVLV